jgi:hypothetical protein
LRSQGSPKGDQEGSVIRSSGEVGQSRDRREKEGRHISPIQAGRGHTWPPESVLPDGGVEVPETVHQQEG